MNSTYFRWLLSQELKLFKMGATNYCKSIFPISPLTERVS